MQAKSIKALLNRKKVRHLKLVHIQIVIALLKDTKSLLKRLRAERLLMIKVKITKMSHQTSPNSSFRVQ